MITGGRIDKVEASRKNEGPISGLSINIGLDNVTVKGNDISVEYTYTVTYAEDVGELKIGGAMFAKEDPTRAKEIEKSWKAERKLPDDFAELVLNTINFTCGSNGTLVVRPVNLSPPMIPPKIEISKANSR
ncbi:Uncharacterised protein [Candidatus Gugararchaeum adminiculabundum]|nr:Uncharacterised protein [Candidatus Gugararchaeum adminiculabundum]